MDRVSAALRSEVRCLKRRYATERYPAELQVRLVEHTRLLRQQGCSWGRIGEALGVAGTSLKRWDERARESDGGCVGALVPVVVVDDVAVVSRGSELPVMITSPTGWRVEGLDLRAAISLLKEVG